MKYPTSIYAKALAEVIIGGKAKREEVVKNLLALLRKNGDEVHLRKIVEEADRFVRAKTGMRKITLESARPLGKSPGVLLAGLKKPGDIIETKVDPKLIAGIRIVVDGERQFDGSLYGKLNKMFSKSTNN